MSVKHLVGRLTPLSKKAFEQGAHLCVASGHYDIDVPHILSKLLLEKESDFCGLLKHYNIVLERVQRDVEVLLQKFKKGNGATPTMSPNIILLLEQSWLISSVELGEEKIRSGAFLYAMLDGKGLLGWCLENLPSLFDIPREKFAQEWKTLMGHLPERSVAKASDRTSETGHVSETPVLDQYTMDLTERARANEFQPIAGRDKEVGLLVDVLSRSRQNNPILLGEAGVGKTAVVEEFALRVARQDVPDHLANIRVLSLDVAMLEAGSGVKGEFESRLTNIIQEAQNSEKPVILFVDEAHTLLGSKKENDAANILKPALARGELRTIAATTFAEYKKYIEKDAALVRRFQVVHIPEPSVEDAVSMVRMVAESLSEKHSTVITDDAIHAAVALSRRYMGDRRLPDKAVSVLDTACARVMISQKVTPLNLETKKKELEALKLELKFLNQDLERGRDCAGLITKCKDNHKIVEKEIETLTAQWEKEKSIVEEVLTSMREQRGAEDLAALQEKHRNVAETGYMIFPFVAKNNVAQVVESWTGIPVSDMVQDEAEVFLSLESKLKERVVDQEKGVSMITDTMKVHKAKLDEPDKPIGCFMLVGPSGVGKTETALVLSECFFGGRPIVVNMSEYQEPHTVSTLRGSPPGYVGYGQGGVLTEGVRRNPYSVILLDEIEKAHPDVIELFFQVLDKGIMEDGEGVRVDFKNTVIIMTSNVGTDLITNCAKTSKDHPEVLEALSPELKKTFPPAFLGRLNVVPYYPLTAKGVDKILALKWQKVVDRVKSVYEVCLSLDPKAHEHLVEQGLCSDSGARVLDNLINQLILPMLAQVLLEKKGSKDMVVSLEKGCFVIKI